LRKDNPKKNIDFEKLYQIDEVLTGKVVRLADFGAFVELPKGGEGLLHISKISKQRVKKVEDVLNVDDSVEIKVLKVKKDRIELASSSL
jgi:polyribonucleotide nucleotidyltransferase